MENVSCDSVYRLNNKRCSREKGHAGEHCHIIWDRNEGERREWWGDDYSVKSVGDFWIESAYE